MPLIQIACVVPFYVKVVQGLALLPASASGGGVGVRGVVVKITESVPRNDCGCGP